MALIECPDCRNQVSDKAAFCPKCACPIGNMPSPSHVTIEKTAKRFKGQELASALMAIIGVIMIPAGSPQVGVPLLAIGVIWFIVVRFMEWWHHG